jgi:hypothetical protein
MSRESNRAKAPTIAAWVDEYRDIAPTGFKVIYASENGHVLDKREKEENAFTIPENYLRPAGGWKRG